jgi:hypothetical protein
MVHRGSSRRLLVHGENPDYSTITPNSYRSRWLEDERKVAANRLHKRSAEVCGLR